MSLRQPVRRAPLGIVALLGSLGAAAGQTADRPEPAVPPPAFLVGVPLDTLKATLERPLFAPSRRPPPIAAPIPAAAPLIAIAPVLTEVAETPRLTLLGIIRAPDSSGSAVVMDDTDRTSISLRLGEGRRGWMVRAIGSDTVTVQKQGRTVDLSFLKARSTAPLSAPAIQPAE